MPTSPKSGLDPHNYESTVTPEMRRPALAENAPRRMMRRPAEAPEAEAPSSRRRARGDDETAEAPSSALIGSGRAGAQQVRNSVPKNFADNYVVPDSPRDDPELIKFIPFIDVPTVSVAEHWCDWQPKGAKKSFVCLGKSAGCPLCAIGESPGYFEIYNILDLRDPSVPKICLLKAAKRLSDDLYALDKVRNSNPPKFGELARMDMYWKIWRTGNLEKGGAATTHMQPVKERDVQEDWGFEPFSEDEMREFAEKATPKDKIIRPNSLKELQEVADAATD